MNQLKLKPNTISLICGRYSESRLTTTAAMILKHVENYKPKKNMRTIYYYTQEPDTNYTISRLMRAASCLSPTTFSKILKQKNLEIKVICIKAGHSLIDILDQIKVSSNKVEMVAISDASTLSSAGEKRSEVCQEIAKRAEVFLLNLNLTPGGLFGTMTLGSYTDCFKDVCDGIFLTDPESSKTLTVEKSEFFEEGTFIDIS